MFAIFQKLLNKTAAAISRGVRRLDSVDKKRLKRSREAIIEASDLAWVNSNANPFNKVDSHGTNAIQNPRATGTRWSQMHADDFHNESPESAALRANERKEALRRIEIVRDHLQKRGQIYRNLHLAKLADEPQDERLDEFQTEKTLVASNWSPTESLIGDFCALEQLAEIESTESDRALEILAINLLKPTVEPEPPVTPAQIAARAAARAAATVQAKTHARLEALKAAEQTAATPEPVVPVAPRVEKAIRPPKLKIRDTEVVPAAMRENKTVVNKSAPVEYKASIQPREDSVQAQNSGNDKSVQSLKLDKNKASTSDTHEKIEERFAYRTSPEHALKLIAQSVDTPAATLARLATHENPHIRTAVARNRSTNSETLWVLARDYEASIRYNLAESTHTPLDILRALTKDGNQLVAWVAQNSLNALKKKLSENAAKLDEKSTQSARERIDALLKRTTRASGDQDIAVLEMTARADSTSAARLGELANHENARVRAAVAENSNAPLHALWSLVRDADPNVKIKLTFNCNCPVEILEVIKNDKDNYVAQKAKDILKGKNSKIQNGVIDAARNIRTYLTWP